MSEVANTTTEATVAPPVSTDDSSVIPENIGKDEAVTSAELPATESKPEESTADDQLKTEAAAAEEDKSESTPAEKVVEPITEGQLTYKGPGLLKSLIPSKKEFWLTDEISTPAELHSFMRGEKPEVAHGVVAWATQTGKGLLFFNKKGETSRKHPGHVLALYDATDLKKPGPQELSFKIGAQEHTLKAASDAERDGWYMSIEKAIELGSASKEEIHESEGYKEELEKLNKPNVTAAAAAASKRSQSQPKKSTEVDRAQSEGPADDKKKNKSRSTSRGVLNRFKGKKEEPEAKKEETEADKEESKSDEPQTTDEIAAASAGTAIAGATALAAAEVPSSEEEKKDSTESPVEASKTEEKTKQKRGSIFGKIGGWGSMKSPTKEKDAELKPDVPAKDGVVSEDPPVLPETATTERTDAEAEATKIESKAEDEVQKENQKEEIATPSKEKSSFLSGLIPKRGRSVSPSANLSKTDAETPKETTEEPAKTTETPAEVDAAGTTDKVEEPAKTETSTPNKRQSVLGSLTRRASKAMGGMRGQKKDNVTPTTETKEETAEPTVEAETPLTNGEAKPVASEQQQIGDVVPSAISVGQEQPPAVTASA